MHFQRAKQVWSRLLPHKCTQLQDQNVSITEKEVSIHLLAGTFASRYCNGGRDWRQTGHMITLPKDPSPRMTNLLLPGTRSNSMSPCRTRSPSFASCARQPLMLSIICSSVVRRRCHASQRKAAPTSTAAAATLPTTAPAMTEQSWPCSCRKKGRTGPRDSDLDLTPKFCYASNNLRAIRSSLNC